MPGFNIIVATDRRGGIGKDNGIPWHFSRDFKYFKEVTSNTTDPSKTNAVIMGRKTYESIPEKFRPLPGRTNIVITRQTDLILEGGVIITSSLQDALDEANNRFEIESVFVIGGGMIYAEAINHPQCDKLYITRISKTYDCDTSFPQIPNNFQWIFESNGYSLKDTTLMFRIAQNIKK
ncbi:dihydrofolate reductase [bacterium]|jgi:dihydrofolate reductase|nr:dihydrofolate reductase [bacterium]